MPWTFAYLRTCLYLLRVDITVWRRYSGYLVNWRYLGMKSVVISACRPAALLTTPPSATGVLSLPTGTVSLYIFRRNAYNYSLFISPYSAIRRLSSVRRLSHSITLLKPFYGFRCSLSFVVGHIVLGKVPTF